jgi:hypothetical protein
VIAKVRNSTRKNEEAGGTVGTPLDLESLLRDCHGMVLVHHCRGGRVRTNIVSVGRKIISLERELRTELEVYFQTSIRHLIRSRHETDRPLKDKPAHRT